MVRASPAACTHARAAAPLARPRLQRPRASTLAARAVASAGELGRARAGGALLGMEAAAPAAVVLGAFREGGEDRRALRLAAARAGAGGVPAPGADDVLGAAAAARRRRLCAPGGAGDHHQCIRARCRGGARLVSLAR